LRARACRSPRHDEEKEERRKHESSVQRHHVRSPIDRRAFDSGQGRTD
jgi:hypothetical protein